MIQSDKRSNILFKWLPKRKRSLNKKISLLSDAVKEPITKRFRPSWRLNYTDRFMRAIFILSSSVAIIFLFIILGNIIIKGGASFKLDFFLLNEDFINEGAGGFKNAIIGSLQLVGISMLIAVPLSVGAALYVNEYSSERTIFNRIILFTSDTLASTPSIVFGAFGFLLFAKFLGFRFSLIAGGMTLSIMALPILLRSSLEALKNVPKEWKDASYALGASKWKTVKGVVLPAALPGVTSGVILSIGRVIGETAAVLFTAGYAITVSDSIMKPVGSLPYLIFKYYSNASIYPDVETKVYGAALCLIIVVLFLNTLSRLIQLRSSRMQKGK
jgi:phosphate transport system permease protein